MFTFLAPLGVHFCPSSCFPSLSSFSDAEESTDDALGAHHHSSDDRVHAAANKAIKYGFLFDLVTMVALVSIGTYALVSGKIPRLRRPHAIGLIVAGTGNIGLLVLVTFLITRCCTKVSRRGRSSSASSGWTSTVNTPRRSHLTIGGDRSRGKPIYFNFNGKSGDS